MTKLNIEFLEAIYLRGLEGMVSDKFLARSLDDNDHNFAENITNHMDAKQIAVQLFFKMKGWGL